MAIMSNTTSGIDKINQATAVLGGATAQSYSAVGLSDSAYGLVSTVSSDLFALVETLKSEGDFNGDPASRAIDKPTLELSISSSTVQSMPSGGPNESMEDPIGFAEPVNQTYELLSRYEVTVPGPENPSGVSSLSVSSAADTVNLSETTEGTQNGFSLPDLIGQAMEQAIAQAEPPQQEVGGAFDGGPKVEMLGSVGHTLTQPIGSAATPSLGTFATDPREELFVYLS